MESLGCYIGLGLVLGVLIGALFAEGNSRRRTAIAKIRALKSEQAKAEDIIKKAKAKHSAGMSEMPGALLMMILAVGLCILAAYILAAVLGAP